MSTANIQTSETGRSLDLTIKDAIQMLPGNIRCLVANLPASIQGKIEEIRLRQERPLIVGMSAEDIFLTPDGRPTQRSSEAYRISSTDMERLLNIISGCSLYALEEELRNGFITLPGGHRVGITGKVILDNGKIKTMKYISGCNFRVSREIKGAATGLLPYIINRTGSGIFHTVLVSPPRCGKTTLLRDLIRQISDGVPEFGFPGLTVGLVDERSEIAGCYKGVPQRDVGVRTDVLDGCPKVEGMMLLLRSMGPQVIAADEIGRTRDVDALEEVLNAGVKLLITAHGSSVADIAERPALGSLIRSKTIERFIVLSRSRGVGTVEDIIDGTSLRSLGVKRC